MSNLLSDMLFFFGTRLPVLVIKYIHTDTSQSYYFYDECCFSVKNPPITDHRNVSLSAIEERYSDVKSDVSIRCCKIF